MSKMIKSFWKSTFHNNEHEENNNMTNEYDVYFFTDYPNFGYFCFGREESPSTAYSVDTVHDVYIVAHYDGTDLVPFSAEELAAFGEIEDDIIKQTDGILHNRIRITSDSEPMLLWTDKTLHKHYPPSHMDSAYYGYAKSQHRANVKYPYESIGRL